jgi:hypothetical protein
MTEKENDPLEIARRLGQSIADDLGAEAFVELEMAYASGLLPRFSDNPLMRVRQNLLLYWEQSYFKSTLLNEFARTIPEELGVIDITAMSPSMIFGSISDDRKQIVKPVFAEKRFAFITELLGFVGSRNTMKDVVNTMNKVMEGETVTRHLVKLGQSDFDHTQIDELKDKGILYDPSNAELSYQPDTCILAASRPIDNWTCTYLRTSGHMYRYHVIQHEISYEEAKRCFVKEFRPSTELQNRLKDLNKDLIKVNTKTTNVPRENIMTKIVEELEESIQDEFDTGKKRLAEIIDVRTRGDITRELRAHAFLRTVAQNGFKDIDSLEYTEDDLAFISQRLEHFVEFKINPLLAQEWTKPMVKNKTRDTAKGVALIFLADGDMKSWSETLAYVKDKMMVGQATVKNALNDLVSEGKICQPKYGYYRKI